MLAEKKTKKNSELRHAATLSSAEVMIKSGEENA